MKPITYLCFTLMSILIQFCLMDFINERIQTGDTFIDHKKTVTGNLSFVLKNIKEKPHALYYRDESQRLHKNINETEKKKYSNSSIQISTFTTSTDFTSTFFDLLYDENVSMAADTTLATETYFNESEYDNVTDITFFDIKTTPKPTETPKKNVNENNCACNLLFNKCDINCCCDSECTITELNLFKNCKRENENQCFNYNRKLQYFCFFQDTCNRDTSNVFDHFLCIDKVNLPYKRKTYNKHENIDVNKYLKWHTSPEYVPLYKFTKNIYVYSQPVWLFKNETLYIISLPITVSNSYCSGKKPIKFLTNEYIKCYVKIKDLHFLYALQLSTESNVISPTEMTTNSTVLNCSTFHCINWTVLVCNDNDCITYNKSLHEPSCSESHCDNIGVKVEYIIYCNDSVITRAILKLYIKQVSMDIGFISQEVKVNFYMGNDSIDDIVPYSGNPGYLKKLPIIVSYCGSNHTKHFYNRTHGNSYNLLLPYNQNGQCIITNITHNIVNFGVNTRLKCRIKLTKLNAIYKTDGCLKIQTEILDLLRLNRDIFISPYGNPNNLSDSKWLRLERFNKSNIYGEYSSKKIQLQCYNLMTRFAYIFTYADIGVSKEEIKILRAIVKGTTKNITFNVNDLSTVITVDTNFLDANTRSYVGASSSFDFSKNLFFPFHNGSSDFKRHTLFLYLCT
ncbi:tectonic, partial [Vanessa atalanta]|uniref:tectonic n=1 Tax=Vanessa atalanta TaxID=42275 RepID=UPI001FCD6D4D